mmetsp:Transcript_158/g.256  ORF Transcript_158/g.256 Transcript_158/m.256 type:complete len:169 (+) Transcript_158:564-1070(+)
MRPIRAESRVVHVPSKARPFWNSQLRRNEAPPNRQGGHHDAAGAELPLRSQREVLCDDWRLFCRSNGRKLRRSRRIIRSASRCREDSALSGGAALEAISRMGGVLQARAANRKAMGGCCWRLRVLIGKAALMNNAMKSYCALPFSSWFLLAFVERVVEIEKDSMPYSF